ncbi:MAG TPA: carbonate dehydratase [Burkholderiales bacterium]|nr:carbonate dehydratase [Burkholderiales bacterium]
MKRLDKLLTNNRLWAAGVRAREPDYFTNLSKIQVPEYLWIGCSDSRVPANQITNLAPGEVFVHRNVANIVVHADLNCLSVLQYAVDVLKVKHVIVCGHYGCGGVTAAHDNLKLGLIDNWLRHVQDVGQKHRDALAAIASREERITRLCELNVIEQALNVAQTTVVQDAWARGQQVAVHSWAYDLKDGVIRDLRMSVENPGDLEPSYEAALNSLDPTGKVAGLGVAR